MNNFVLFTAVGTSDPIKAEHDGPILHIVRHYQPQKVYMFLSQEMETRGTPNSGGYSGTESIYETAIRHVSPECEVKKISSGITQVQDFDIFTELFMSILNEIVEENPEAEILLNISSGTVQMKSAMCLLTVSYSKTLKPIQVEHPNAKANDAPTLYLHKDRLEDWISTNMDELEDEPSRCKESNILSFKKTMLKTRIKSLINNYDYTGAYGLVQENKELFTENTAKLLYHTKKRLNLEYAEAEKTARELGQYNLFYPIANTDVKKVSEYYMSMKIKQIKAELSDFVLRLNPIADELGRYMLENVFLKKLEDLTTEDKKKVRHFDEVKSEKSIPGITEYLDAQFGGSFKWGGFVNLLTIQPILSYMAEKENKEDITEVLLEMEKWSSISTNIRNYAAHTISEVTEEMIRQEYGKSSKDLCNNIQTVLKRIYKNEFKIEIMDIYNKINQMIAEEMDKI